ncbi:MAG TPA: glycosyltransferase family 2 protein [Gammaproteobacteria bacterium]|nr:glycosyltransferase family 2 protein [Gammaproteobacteria bacterium]
MHTQTFRDDIYFLTTDHYTELMVDLTHIFTGSNSTGGSIRLAAMYKLFFAEEWLEDSVASVINHVQYLCFIISDRTWSDSTIPGDQDYILAYLANLKLRYPDRIFVYKGSWASQLDHVQDSLEFVRQSCPEASHVLYIDSDEIYPDGQLEELIHHASDPVNKLSALHVSWYTFFKSVYFRVDPVEPYRPLVLFPLLPEVRFTKFREVNLPFVEVPVCIFHFSYVRHSDERIRQKLLSFQKDERIQDGWFEKVWLNWHFSMRDFHPVHPRNYHALVLVNTQELPPAVVTRFKTWQSGLTSSNSIGTLNISGNTNQRVNACSLGFVLVTHHSAVHLEKCLKYIAATPHQSVLIVDNASSDETINIAGRFGASIITLQQNLGYGRAANIGARISHCTILCFINPDCFIDAGTVNDALAVLGNQPTACVVPKLREGENMVHGKQPGYTSLKLLHDMCETNNRCNDLFPVLREQENYHDTDWYWPHGACFFIHRNIFNNIGGFDENYFMYMEDVELGRRLYAHGYSVVSLNRTVTHNAQTGSNIDSVRRRALLNKARLLYAEQNYGSRLYKTILPLVRE